jgi:hypothetical protein
MKFQTIGSCIWGYDGSHLNPHKIAPEKCDEISGCLDKLYVSF